MAMAAAEIEDMIRAAQPPPLGPIDHQPREGDQ